MDRPRIRPTTWPAVATPLMVGLGCVTSITGLSAWLLFTDPIVAADIAAAGSLMPLVEAIVDTLRSALSGLLAYL